MMDAERLSLLRAAQDGDPSAMDAMVRENTGLIWAVARRFFGRGVEPDDLLRRAEDRGGDSPLSAR